MGSRVVCVLGWWGVSTSPLYGCPPRPALHLQYCLLNPKVPKGIRYVPNFQSQKRFGVTFANPSDVPVFSTLIVLACTLEQVTKEISSGRG